jgi:DNA-binding NarL/FixJ family response regulator
VGKIRVVVADDHTIVREGIRALLARRKDIELVGEAGDGEQAVAQVAALHPDVVLMDITMPGMDGLEATRRIHQSFPDTRVLVLTQYENKEYVLPLLRAGAAGYLVKITRSTELVAAIRAVHAQGAYLPPNIAQYVVSGIAGSVRPGPTLPPTLSEREQEVVRLIASGATSRGIADRLHISVRTVDTHRANIMEKIGVHSTAELTMYAIREGIVNL